MVSEIRRTPSEKCLTRPPSVFIQGVLPQSMGGRPSALSLHVVLVDLGESGVRGEVGRVGSGVGEVGLSVRGFGVVPEVRGVFSSILGSRSRATPPNGRGRSGS